MKITIKLHTPFPIEKRQTFLFLTQNSENANLFLQNLSEDNKQITITCYAITDDEIPYNYTHLLEWRMSSFKKTGKSDANAYALYVCRNIFKKFSTQCQGDPELYHLFDSEAIRFSDTVSSNIWDYVRSSFVAHLDVTSGDPNRFGVFTFW
jgi:hypothetical protein